MYFCLLCTAGQTFNTVKNKFYITIKRKGIVYVVFLHNLYHFNVVRFRPVQ